MFNDLYPKGLILDVRFRFNDYDFLVTDVNKKTYMLNHFSNKRVKPFKVINWHLNNGSIGIWYCKKFITRNELRKKAYKVNERLIIFENYEDITPF